MFFDMTKQQINAFVQQHDTKNGKKRKQTENHLLSATIIAFDKKILAQNFIQIGIWFDFSDNDGFNGRCSLATELIARLWINCLCL